MKSFNSHLILMIGLALLLFSCENENKILELEIPAQSDEIRNLTITFDELPSNIKGVLLEADKTLLKLRESVILDRNSSQTSPDGDEENMFGQIDYSRINVLNEDNGESSYTLRLTKMGDGLYFDNFILQEQSDGSFTPRLTRYRPSQNWLNNHNPEYPRYDTFDGRIDFYTEIGHFLYSILVSNGEVIEQLNFEIDDENVRSENSKQTSSINKNANSVCIITIQFAGLEQNGIFYITDVRYNFSGCGGSGSGSGGSGSGSSGGGGFDGDGEDDGNNGGGGSGSGSGGVGTNPIIDEDGNFDFECPPGSVSTDFGTCVSETTLGPSCESFKFQKTTAFWQESAVRNIGFSIFLSTNEGTSLRRIEFPQPILFGLPSNFSVGGNLSPGAAAELAAETLDAVFESLTDDYARTQPKLVRMWLQMNL